MSVPRTWTLSRRFGEPFDVSGPGVRSIRGPVKVIEAEPVLDLLKRARTYVRPGSPPSETLIEEIDDLLREHGRLEGCE